MEKNVCKQMFNRKSEDIKCISIGNVCDNYHDCLYHDDEMFCHLKSLQCPLPCICLIYALTCPHLPQHTLAIDNSVSYLSVTIFKSNTQSLDIFTHKLENVKIIQMPDNRITSICPVQFLKNILVLNVSNNIIEEIRQECFSLSKLLKSIYLNDNTIIYIYEYAFNYLDHLMFLNLSSNPLNNLPSKCFSNILSMKILNMQNIKFKKIQSNSFSSTNVKIIRIDDNKISCVSPVNSFCTSYLPWYISSSDILPSTAMKRIFKIISILIVFLNIISILIAFLFLQKVKHYHKFQIIVIGLNFSDILCGIYLMGIWVSDTMLKAVYLINENLWKYLNL